MKILKRLFGKSTDQAPPTVFSAPILPNRPLYVIGDIHGRADLLAKMLDRLADIREPESDLVFVGDIVDRGEDSALTLSTIKDITENPENAAHCLMGNHEKMLLDFLDEPTVKGARWLQYGGLQTLMSFGLREVTERASDEVLMAARDVFAETLPQETQTWLRELPLRFASGNVSVVHAAAGFCCGVTTSLSSSRAPMTSGSCTATPSPRNLMRFRARSTWTRAPLQPVA
jgi:serine/threonine protein phosphatase 1